MTVTKTAAGLSAKQNAKMAKTAGAQVARGRSAGQKGKGKGKGKEKEKEREGAASPDFTAIILTLVRLERELTDILITINVPHIKGEYDEDDVDLELGRQGRLIGDAVDYAAKIWESFKVKDWNLFKEV